MENDPVSIARGYDTAERIDFACVKVLKHPGRF